MPAAKPTTPPRGFTPKFIDGLAPLPAQPGEERGKSYDLGDGPENPGLRLRVYPSGVKSFFWKVNSLHRTVVLGPWSLEPRPGHITLKQAHAWLRRLKDARKGGTLDAEEAELRAFLGRSEPGQKNAGEAEAPMTVEALCANFYRERILPFRSRPDGADHVLRRDIIPCIGNVAVCDLSKLIVQKPVKAAVARGSKGHAVTVLQITKMLTKYAYNADLIPVDYGASLDRKYLGAEAHSRGRYLGEDELPTYLRTMEPKRPARKKLNASEAILFGFSILLRVGERPIALRNARWSDIDLKAGVWTQPASRQSKKKKAERETAPDWEIPLARQTVRFLKKLRVLTGHGELVWPITDHAAARALTRLQDAGLLKLDEEKGKVVPYDLRRTLRAGLERLGVPYEICEKTLNHKVRGAVAATYARDPLLDRRREAAQAWADYLDKLAAPVPDNVVAIGGGKAPAKRAAQGGA